MVDWKIEEGQLAEAGTQLQAALPFWHSVGARRYLEQGESLLAASS